MIIVCWRETGGLELREYARDERKPAEGQWQTSFTNEKEIPTSASDFSNYYSPRICARWDWDVCVKKKNLNRARCTWMKRKTRLICGVVNTSTYPGRTIQLTSWNWRDFFLCFAPCAVQFLAVSFFFPSSLRGNSLFAGEFYERVIFKRNINILP